jgi:hypothetical protein
MPSPTVDPKTLQVMDALCAKLATISSDNGYYSDVAGASIEPTSLDNQDAYPQVIVEEESDEITDSTALALQNSMVLRVAGFVSPSSSKTPARDAYKLRADMTNLLRTVKSSDFLDGSGKQLITSYQVIGKRDIGFSPRNPSLFEVAVRVSIDFRDFSTPVVGT